MPLPILRIRTARVNHEHALLREIVEFPEDDGPRLIYADWLDERDRPRGEFIRLQFALAENRHAPHERVEIEARARHLLACHASAWLGPLRRHLESWTFRRGFVERIKLSIDTFLDHAEDLRGAFPLQEIVLTGASERLHELAATPKLAGLRGLGFERTWLAHRAAMLADSAHLASLRRLDLRNNGIGTAALAELAHSGALPSLRQLALGRNTALRDDGMRILLDSPLAEQLRDVDLSGCRLTDASVRRLATSPWLARLELLDLRGNSISLAGYEALLASPYWHERVGLRIPPAQSRRLHALRADAGELRDRA